MLDSKHCTGVGSILKKKKDRAELDSPISLTQTSFKEIAKDYNNIQYVCKNPKDKWYDCLEGRELQDPNNPTVISQDKDWSWLFKTWDNYIKKKYKKFLNKQNKEIGGGDDTLLSSQDYLDRPDYWITQVFCHDIEASYLLCQSVDSRMPRELLKEPGFDFRVESDANTSTKGNKWDKLLQENAQRQESVIEMIKQQNDLLMSRNTSKMGTPETVIFDYCHKRAKQYKEIKKELDQDSDSNLSRDTKENAKQSLKRKYNL